MTVKYDAQAAERLLALQRTFGCIPSIGEALNRDVAAVLAEREELRGLLNEARCYVQSFILLTKLPVAAKDAAKLRDRIIGALHE